MTVLFSNWKQESEYYSSWCHQAIHVHIALAYSILNICPRVGGHGHPSLELRRQEGKRQSPGNKKKFKENWPK